MTAAEAAPALPLHSALELATGLLLGPDEHAPSLRRARHGIDPRQALEEVIRHFLQREPCVVSFSGGRDSSAILAVAAHVARRDGLPLPIPATLRFSGVPEAEEAAWQELVIGHLGLPDWQRIVITDELDMLGPGGRATLETYGPHSPAQLHFDLPLLQISRGGSLLTGEGGDDLFDERRPRYLKYYSERFRRRPRACHLRSMAFALAPVPVRRRTYPRRMASSWSGTFDWLRPQARAEVLAMIADEIASEPLRWRSFVPWLAGRRGVRVPAVFRDHLARAHDVRCNDPLLDPAALAALVQAKSGWGWPDRTAAFRELFGDLLPDEVLGRWSKATFDGALFRDGSRRFALSWDGRGLDDSLVNVERLRRAWAGPDPDTRSFPLLRMAWWHCHTAASEVPAPA